MAAIRDRDLDGILATYADDAVLVDTDRIGRGLDHVRAAHAEVLDAAAELAPALGRPMMGRFDVARARRPRSTCTGTRTRSSCRSRDRR